jgi:hypothetical protein
MKEDHATSVVHVSFEDTHPVPSIIIINIITLVIRSKHFSSTTTLKCDYPS